MKLTVPQAARRAGRSPETIRRWIWSGRLPSEKVGNQHVIDEYALSALVATEDAPEAAPPVTVGGEWGAWLHSLGPLHAKLHARGARFPPAGSLVHEARRGR